MNIRLNNPTYRQASQRGFVLFAVLAIMAVLSVLVVAIRTNTAAVTQETIYLLKQQNRLALVQSGFETAAAKILSREPDAPLSGAFSAAFSQGTVSGTYRNQAGQVDLNFAPMALLQAMGSLAGLSISDRDKIAGRIIDWRDDNNQQEISGADEKLDYFSTLNKQPRNAPFQSILELGQIPGITPAMNSEFAKIGTITSGLASVNLNLVSLELLVNVPGISPLIKAELAALLENDETPDAQFVQRIASDPALQNLVGASLSKSWRVEMEVTLNSRSPQKANGVIAFLTNDTRAFRILEYEGPLEIIE